MGIRVTTWNVNGIRNPFGYQPWRDAVSFERMFELLEADIICFQEAKIQRKDLRDDMVLVPGWDCYFSLPKHKKGYSGVVIYTKNSVCAPVRAEEGITGVLTRPNSTTSFRDLPEGEQIGGYPTDDQLSLSDIDATTLDSEGRAVILEFPAFVLIGTYCPAARDNTRDAFRIGYLNMVDARIRNLTKQGKRVIWTGDLNISREELDTAAAEESMRKHGLSGEEFVSTTSRRLLNQLLDGGKVFGQRDEGREESIMWDTTRGFHPGRKGMFTCWETKVNARPGNYGARIDYVLSSIGMKDWFIDSNIQEGLMGSDHCPVYATLDDQVSLDGKSVSTLDLLNPLGTFQNGARMRPWTTKNLLPTSGKLIPEFDRRRNIKDMFSRTVSIPKAQGLVKDQKDGTEMPSASQDLSESLTMSPNHKVTTSVKAESSSKSEPQNKRNAGKQAFPQAKRLKTTASSATRETSTSQRTLKGFFAPKDTAPAPQPDRLDGTQDSASDPQASPHPPPLTTLSEADEDIPSSKLIDPIVSKESWGRLFIKPTAPNCDHEEPCKTMLTKKSGVNCGRSFWMCARPLGPSGNKEKGSQWRCGTFIWASDWSGGG